MIKAIFLFAYLDLLLNHEMTYSVIQFIRSKDIAVWSRKNEIINPIYLILTFDDLLINNCRFYSIKYNQTWLVYILKTISAFYNQFNLLCIMFIKLLKLLDSKSILPWVILKQIFSLKPNRYNLQSQDKNSPKKILSKENQS